jgi:hypothetical protein
LERKGDAVRIRRIVAGVVVALSLFAGAGGASAATPISKILPDQQGHPFAGQWAEVLKAEVIATFGFTGSLGTTIVADFPGTSAVPQRLTFSYYGVQDAIPTSFLLPCSGSAPVVFRPEPTSPTAKSFTVMVNFVGQP